jgi:predicted ester cyclase
MIRDIRDAMPDVQVVIEECIAEGYKVMTWSTLIGTIQKPAFGYPPSDKVVSISVMAF